MSETTVPEFSSERSNTDQSLSAERKKATDALTTAGTKNQTKTDRIVHDERVIADQKTAESRIDHDEARDSKASGASIAAIESHLNEERHRTDLATEEERARVDEAILKERKIASDLVATVLERERSATDKSLSAERDVTDVHVSGKSELLTVELSAHAKTKDSLTTRDEFLAIVSHDLRNPLGAVKSYAELILDDSNELNQAEVRQYAEAIKRNSESALRLISDLLDVERMSSGKIQIKCADCNINDAIGSAYETFAVEAANKKVTIKFEREPTGATVHVDRDRVNQIVVNLLGNALKFTPEGGTIDIVVKKSADDFQLSVRDSGPGIAKEQSKLIFDKFTQLGKKDRDGLGLGLYISKMLAESHRGKLWVESELGRGSTFHLKIPHTAVSAGR